MKVFRPQSPLDRMATPIQGKQNKSSRLDRLRVERANCIGQRLRRYVAGMCQRELDLHWQQVFRTHAKPFCELQMVGPAGKVFSARLDTVLWPEQRPPKECLVALSDISARKE